MVLTLINKKKSDYVMFKRLVYLTSGDAPLLEAPAQLRNGERRELIKRGKRRFVFRRAENRRQSESQKIRSRFNDPAMRSTLISGPSEFKVR